MMQRTINKDRRVTLGKAVLKHLGVGPGEKLAMEIRPDHRIVLSRLELSDDEASGADTSRQKSNRG